jgi:hypothetical protein
VLDGDQLTDLVPGPPSVGGLGQPVGLNRSANPDALDHCGSVAQHLVECISERALAVHVRLGMSVLSLGHLSTQAALNRMVRGGGWASPHRH